MASASTAAVEVGSPLVLTPAARLQGDLALPGDKSVSHRALMLALLSDGTTRITGAGDGEDVRSTARVAAALGAEVDRTVGVAGNVDYVVRSGGGAMLRQPAGVLDCGNSGTSLRLFAGILSGMPLQVTLDGDASLRGRPMTRIVEPLRAMGATIDAPSAAGQARPPLAIRGRRPLHPVDWSTPIASAQVKSAIVLAGASADGTTTVREAVATRDHTERMLRSRGVAVRTALGAGGSNVVEIDGPAVVAPLDEDVPGDPSAAAFWLVAGAIHRAADLRIVNVGVNPTRRGLIDVLRRMGASIEEAGEPDDGIGEPVAGLRVRSSELIGTELEPAETAASIDEIPILCLAATQARGRSVVRGAGELRHKESDRIVGIVAGLGALGARIGVDGDDLVIDGPVELRGAAVDSLGDHRLAMTFAIAGLLAQGTTTIIGAESVAISYPAFFADLERIRS